MKLALWISMVTALCAITTRASAQEVPGTMSFTGRLASDDGPTTGSVDLTFRIYDVDSGGDEVWTEEHPGVAAEKGLVFVMLGSDDPLDPTVLDGGLKFLEVEVDGETLSPRVPLGAVPYAVRATAADTANTAQTASTAETLGTLAPGDVADADHGHTLSCQTATDSVDISGTGHQSTIIKPCPGGTTVTGGGCSNTGTNAFITVNEPSANGWKCLAVNKNANLGDEITLTVFARCCTIQ